MKREIKKSLSYLDKYLRATASFDIPAQHWKIIRAALVEGQKPPTNKQSVAALWRAICSDSVRKSCVHGGVWLPLTKERLNAAYIKVYGL